MKVRMTNEKVMELYGAVTGAQKQLTENDRRFNYAVERNAGLLSAVVKEIRKKDAENLRGYYEAVDKEEESAKKSGAKLDDPAWMDRLKDQFAEGFIRNRAMLKEVREVVLYEIKFEWLPNLPGFVQRALGPVTTKPSEEEMEQPEIAAPEAAAETEEAVPAESSK